jgi:hypothetical protein
MSIELSLIVGAVFGIAAGAMAFLITFDEYRKHQMARRRLWAESLKAGAFAFVVFLLMSVAAGAWLKG